MRWFAIHHELATNLKWLDLSMTARGAWITLLAIAAAGDERGTIRDRATAERLVRRDLQSHSDEADRREATGLLDELIEGGWIDIADDGQLRMHDFDEWQLRIKKPSDWPDAIRERVGRHRRAKREEKKEELEPERESEGTPGNALQEPIPLVTDANLYRVMEGLTGIPPTFKDKQDIDRYVDRWGRTQVRNAMLLDPNPKRNPDRFLGRLWHRLKEAA